MVQGMVKGAQDWPEGLGIIEGTPLNADTGAATVLIQSSHVSCLLHVACIGTGVWQRRPRQSLPAKQLPPFTHGSWLTCNKPYFTGPGAQLTAHHGAHCVIHHGYHINTVGLGNGENMESEPAWVARGPGFGGYPGSMKCLHASHTLGSAF